MTTDRFNECLQTVGWTETQLATSLGCDVSWVDAIASGEIEAPPKLAAWLEVLAQLHKAAPPPTTYRGKKA